MRPSWATPWLVVRLASEVQAFKLHIFTKRAAGRKTPVGSRGLRRTESCISRSSWCNFFFFQILLKDLPNPEPLRKICKVHKQLMKSTESVDDLYAPRSKTQFKMLNVFLQCDLVLRILFSLKQNTEANLWPPEIASVLVAFKPFLTEGMLWYNNAGNA